MLSPASSPLEARPPMWRCSEHPTVCSSLWTHLHTPVSFCLFLCPTIVAHVERTAATARRPCPTICGADAVTVRPMRSRIATMATNGSSLVRSQSTQPCCEGWTTGWREWLGLQRRLYRKRGTAHRANSARCAGESCLSKRRATNTGRGTSRAYGSLKAQVFGHTHLPCGALYLHACW